VYPKQVKYLKLWNPDLIILCYTNSFTPNNRSNSKIQFLTKENCYIFRLLLYVKTFQNLSNKNQEHHQNSQLGYWLVTNLKNKKLLLSNIWIPNLLYSDNKNNLPIPTTENQNDNLTMLNLPES
jgi:hypothetical protein